MQMYGKFNTHHPVGAKSNHNEDVYRAIDSTILSHIALQQISGKVPAKQRLHKVCMIQHLT